MLDRIGLVVPVYRNVIGAPAQFQTVCSKTKR